MNRHMFIIVAVAGLTACGSDDDVKPAGGGDNANANSAAIPYAYRIEIPRLKGGSSKFITYTTTPPAGSNDEVNFCVEWDCALKSQRWTAYTFTKAHFGSNYTWSHGNEVRNYPYDTQNLDISDYFTTSNQWSDYFYGTGYDHGHICANADRKYSTEANRQTYYMTNMQPQYSAFNGSTSNYQGLWVRMEGQVRTWAKALKYGETLYVCKGGTIDNEENIITRLGGCQIAPRYFFMALLHAGVNAQAASDYRAIALFTEQTTDGKCDVSISSTAMSIDELEKRTGIDFFCNLPDDIENVVEASYGTKVWSLK